MQKKNRGNLIKYSQVKEYNMKIKVSNSMKIEKKTCGIEEVKNSPGLYKVIGGNMWPDTYILTVSGMYGKCNLYINASVGNIEIASPSWFYGAYLFEKVENYELSLSIKE